MVWSVEVEDLSVSYTNTHTVLNKRSVQSVNETCEGAANSLNEENGFNILKSMGSLHHDRKKMHKPLLNLCLLENCYILYSFTSPFFLFHFQMQLRTIYTGYNRKCYTAAHKTLKHKILCLNFYS